MTSTTATVGRSTAYRRALLALAFCVFGILVVGAFAESARAEVEAPPPPQVWTDKADYAPGETVTLSGANWAPAESVHVVVNDDAGQTWRHENDVAAGNDGTFSAQFQLPEWFVATYMVTASGAQSGTATWTFTDGDIRVRAGRSPSDANTAVTVAAGNLKLFSSNDCSGTATSSNANPFTTDGGTGNGYENPSPAMAAPPGRSFSVQVPSSVTVGTTTYSFSGWRSDSVLNATHFSTTGTTGCFQSLTGGQISITASYVDTVNTTTTASSATATFGDSSVTLAATVAPASGPAPSVGTVTFTVKKGATTVGTAGPASVTGGAASANFSLAGVNADTYTIEAAYSGGTGFNPSNNSGQSPAPTLTVAKASSTTTVTCPVSVVYDGSAQTPCSASVTGAGGLNQALTVNYTNNTNAGTATASASYPGDANHNGSSDSKTFEIEKRPITVKANDVTRTYGNATPAFSLALFAGSFASGEGFADLGGTAAFDTGAPATGHQAVGVYPIDVSGLTSSNYDISYASGADRGKLTIEKRELTVKADNKSKDYDGSAFTAFTSTITGFASGENDSVISGAVSYGGSAVGAVNAGSYTITADVSGLSASNYSFSAQDGTLTINKVVLTVKADNKSKVFDGSPFTAFTRTITGFVNGENESVISGTVSYGGNAIGATAVGTYTITPIVAGLSATNYAFSPQNGTLTIGAWNAQGHGFYAPVGVANSIFTAAPGTPPTTNPGEYWNTAKGGSTIPLKFNVFAGEVEKTSLSDIAGFQAAKLNACSGGSGEEVVEFVTTGSTNLRYDTTAMQWIQNWQTPKVNTDSCYRAWVTFRDGSSLEAFFKLRR
jgi:MBG domain-containing protein/Big-like domain-containing protein